MDAKTILATLTRLVLASIAGTLVKDGLLQASATQTFIGAGMLVATGMWGLWNGYGKDIAKASLIILRAKVLNAAERAQYPAGGAGPALASLAAHVKATAPEVAPASPASPVASVIALAIGLALVLASHPAAAQTAPRPAARPAPSLTGNPVTDIGNAIKGGGQPSEVKLTGDPIADLHSAIKNGGAKLIMHLKQSYALAMAKGSAGLVTDNTSAMCTRALVPIVDLVVNGPKMGTLDPTDAMALTADETTLAANTSEPEGPIVQIEKLRILRLAVTGTALNDACGALVQDEVKNAQALVGKLTSLITGAGLLGIGIP